MAAKENPFGVLGFAPSAFEGLGIEQIQTLIKGAYRNLAALHHPDKGGKEHRFKEVQDAFETLEEEIEFNFWFAQFMRSKKDHVKELGKELKAAQKEVARQREALADFWLAVGRGRKIIRQEESAFGTRLSEVGKVKEVSIFDPPPCRVLIMDMMYGLAMQKAGENAGNRACSPPPDSIEMRIDEKGMITVQRLVKSYFDPKQEDFPQVEDAFIEVRTGVSAKSYYWVRKGEPKVENVRILGSIEKDLLTSVERRKTTEVAGLLGGKVGPDDFLKAREGYPLADFQPYLQFLTPYIKKDDFLVSMSIGTAGPFFRVWGYIRKILDL